MNKEQYMDLFSVYQSRLAGDSFFAKLVSAIQDNIEEFQILKPTDSDTYFPSFLKSKLERFCAFFEHILRPIIALIPAQDDSGTLDNGAGEVIKNISEALNRSVDLYYLGNINNAAVTLGNALDLLFTDQKGLTEDLLTVLPVQPGMDFFRARTIDDAHRTKDEMFHIPFDKRHFASTNRYSIPGVPALYVSTDPYTCFVELDKPDVKTLNYSLLKNNETLNVLMLQRAEDKLYDTITLNAKSLQNNYYGQVLTAMYIVDYLKTFPLIIACTIKVLNSKAPFKPEYIIPQLLLQYLRSSEKIDGIMYPSSKLKYEAGFGFQGVFYNYVFPVKSTCESGYCLKLSKQFSITEPTSLAMEGVEDMPQPKLLEELYLVVNALDSRPLLSVTM